MRTILIVEDDAALAHTLQVMLQREGYSVVVADTGAGALGLADASHFDLALLDVQLPDTSGFDVLRQLRAAGRKQPILMASARAGEVDKVLGLELGADDYLVKPFGGQELLARVRAALRRAYGAPDDDAPAGPTDMVVLGAIVIEHARLRAKKNGRALPLTETEFKLLRALAGQPNRPMTRLQIARVINADTALADDRAIDSHVRNLRKKIEDDPARPRFIVTVRGTGYKFVCS